MNSLKEMRASRGRAVVVVIVVVVLAFLAPTLKAEDPLLEELLPVEESDMGLAPGKRIQPEPEPEENSDDSDSETEAEHFREIHSHEEEVSDPRPPSPYVITDSDWERLDSGEWFIEFYAPWCPACRALQPRWDELARDLHALQSSKARVAKCDVTDNPWLTGRMMIATLPSIFHVKDKEYRKYTGKRSVEDMMEFVVGEKWRQSPVLEKWREPHGVAMKAMSGFYKLANLVQSAHDLMTITYGFPVWASYVVFGLSTLACGLTMGLIIVCCMDCLSTPSTPERRAAIAEKNRRAREERRRQAEMLEAMEAKKRAREEEDPDVVGREEEEEEEAEILMAEVAEEDGEKETTRRRKGYRRLEEEDEEEEGGRESTEEEDYEETEESEGETEEEGEETEDKKKR